METLVKCISPFWFSFPAIWNETPKICVFIKKPKWLQRSLSIYNMYSLFHSSWGGSIHNFILHDFRHHAVSASSSSKLLREVWLASTGKHLTQYLLLTWHDTHPVSCMWMCFIFRSSLHSTSSFTSMASISSKTVMSYALILLQSESFSCRLHTLQTFVGLIHIQTLS